MTLETLLWYGVLATTALLDGYALLALARHALGLRRWDDHPIIVAPALAMLGTTLIAIAIQGLVWLLTALLALIG